MASVMDVDEEEVEMASSSSGKGDKKRFEVKKVIVITPNHCNFLSMFLCLKII